MTVNYVVAGALQGEASLVGTLITGSSLPGEGGSAPRQRGREWATAVPLPRTQGEGKGGDFGGTAANPTPDCLRQSDPPLKGKVCG